MGKGKRLKKKQKSGEKQFGKTFSELLTKNFQEELRNSPIWDEMVAEYGEQRAEKILKQCKGELKLTDTDR
jgi:hypothetical protein